MAIRLMFSGSMSASVHNAQMCGLDDIFGCWRWERFGDSLGLFTRILGLKERNFSRYSSEITFERSGLLGFMHSASIARMKAACCASA
jgi:hypothetical protein